MYVFYLDWLVFCGLPGKLENMEIFDLSAKVEAGEVKLQSRLEEEEQDRLTKLKLVSTKTTAPQSLLERQGNRRRHSFGEEEIAENTELQSTIVTLREQLGRSESLSGHNELDILSQGSGKPTVVSQDVDVHRERSISGNSAIIVIGI